MQRAPGHRWVLLLSIAIVGWACGGLPPPPPPPTPPPAPEPEPEPEPIVLAPAQLVGGWISASYREWPTRYLEIASGEGGSLLLQRICDGPPPYGDCVECAEGEVTAEELSLTLRCEAEDPAETPAPIQGEYAMEEESIRLGDEEVLARTDELGLEYWRDFRDLQLSGRNVDPEPTKLIYDVAREAATSVLEAPEYRHLRYAVDQTFRLYSRLFQCRVSRLGSWARRRDETDCAEHRGAVVEAVSERIERRFGD